MSALRFETTAIVSEMWDMSCPYFVVTCLTSYVLLALSIIIFPTPTSCTLGSIKDCLSCPASELDNPLIESFFRMPVFQHDNRCKQTDNCSS